MLVISLGVKNNYYQIEIQGLHGHFEILNFKIMEINLYLSIPNGFCSFFSINLEKINKMI